MEVFFFLLLLLLSKSNQIKLIPLIFSSLLFADGQPSLLDFDFDASMSVLTLRKPGMNAGVDWTVTLL